MLIKVFLFLTRIYDTSTITAYIPNFSFDHEKVELLKIHLTRKFSLFLTMGAYIHTSYDKNCNHRDKLIIFQQCQKSENANSRHINFSLKRVQQFQN